MPEFVVRAAVEEDGEAWVLVETPSASRAAGCGTRAQLRGRRRTKVRDLKCGGRPVVLVWIKRRWRCPDPDCDVRTFEQAERGRPQSTTALELQRGTVTLPALEMDGVPRTPKLGELLDPEAVPVGQLRESLTAVPVYAYPASPVAHLPELGPEPG